MRKEDKPEWLNQCEWVEVGKDHWAVLININGEKIPLVNILKNLHTFKLK